MLDRYTVQQSQVGDRVTWLVLDTQDNKPVTWSNSKARALDDADRLNRKERV